MIRNTLIILAILMFGACKNKKTAQVAKTDSVSVPSTDSKDPLPPEYHTDTLQFIHFEGDFDYWSGVFLNSSKDTVKLVTHEAIAYNLKNSLFEVKWFTDTLEEAGDNSMYLAKRILNMRVIDGTPFVQAKTEEQILNDIREIHEVYAGADVVRVTERPSEGKDYYVVETGSQQADNFSRLFIARVYIYPNYQIRIYDPRDDNDYTVEEWRNLYHPKK